MGELAGTRAHLGPTAHVRTRTEHIQETTPQAKGPTREKCGRGRSGPQTQAHRQDPSKGSRSRERCEGGTRRRCSDRLAERSAADDPCGAVAEPRAETAIGADEPPRAVEARRELDDGVIRVARPDEVRRLLGRLAVEDDQQIVAFASCPFARDPRVPRGRCLASGNDGRSPRPRPRAPQPKYRPWAHGQDACVKKIGFLSFGHWSQSPSSQVRSASDALMQSLRAGRCRRGGRRGWCVLPRPPLRAPAGLAVPAAGGRRHVEDRDRDRRRRHALREPFYMAEDAGAADLLAGARLQLGISGVARAGDRRVALLRPPAGGGRDRRRHGGATPSCSSGSSRARVRPTEPAADVPEPAGPAAHRAPFARTA